MNIYDNAHELAKSLKNSEEYCSFLQAKKVVDTDEAAKKMVKEFLGKQVELEMEMMAGKGQDKTKTAELQKMYELISFNTKARDFMQAHIKFQRVMSDVYKIIGESVAEGMDFFGKNKLAEVAAKLQSALIKGELLINEPMSRHTTFKIGGPADYFVMPASVEEVSSLVKIAQEYELPMTILGNGSNMLVLDKGIRGLVLSFSNALADICVRDDLVIAGAGALLKDVSLYAAEKSMLGLEFAVGIPGSIGGAVFMNAGAYEGDISSVVSAVTAVCREGTIRRFTTDELNFSYRHSCFQDNGCLICEVELKLRQGDRSFIRSKMDDFTERRESKQPLEMPSAGSTFKRPPGHFAGTLIEQAGLKGLRVGGAEVSPKHAGFIVNAGGATAEDVLNLIKKVQELVYEHAGVMLQPEVRIIGEE